LSRLPESFVIACNTAFTFKGKPIDVKRIGRELGVRYVLEGSVRKSGQRVRVNAQLIDPETGGHLWADRFDREVTDVFALQRARKRLPVGTPWRVWPPSAGCRDWHRIGGRGRSRGPDTDV